MNMTLMEQGIRLPEDMDAEQAVLGACFAHPHLIDEILGACGPGDYFHAPHPQIAEAILVVHGDRVPVTPLTVASKMAGNASFLECGGRDYLDAMRLSTPVNGSLALARNLADLRLRRDAISATMRTQEALSAPACGIVEAMRPVLDMADHAANVLGKREFVSIRDAADAMLRSASDRAAGRAVVAATTGINLLDEAIGGLQGGDLVVYAGRPGMGKAQPIAARVLLKCGTWTAIGSLKLGDELASIDGAPSRVSGVFPRGLRPVFRVSFSDGRSAEACGEHLWEVMYRDWPAPRVITTDTLAEMLTKKRYQKRLSVRRCSGHFGHDEELPVEPYLLGLLLGDGGLTGNNPRFTSADAEIIETMAERLPAEMEVRKTGGSTKYAYNLTMRRGSFRGIAPKDRKNSLTTALTSLGAMGKSAAEKSIPIMYLTAHREARLELLRGLLDTDGWAETEGAVRFCTVSERLASDVQYLVRSLGGQCAIKNRQTNCHAQGTKKAGLPSYVCKIRHENGEELFRLSRKAERAKRGRNSTVSLTVESVVPSRTVKTVCIRVTHPSSLYITDDFVVTHNTCMLATSALRSAMEGRPVLFFSLEMTQERLLQRIGCDLDFDDHAHRPISYSWFRNGTAKHDDIARLGEGLKHLPPSLSIIENGSLDIHEIAAMSRARAARENVMGLVVIDYLQKVSAGDRYRGNRVQEVTEISGAAKALAMRLKWPVVVGAQLNRGVENREEKRPNLTDLRESGAIEQDADAVIGLYRPGYYIDKRKPAQGRMDPAWNAWEMEWESEKNRLDLLVMKNRNGAEDSFSVFCDMRASAIRNEEPRGARHD